MRLCNTDSQINCFTFSHLYVVIQFVWIAAFLVSTKFEHFRCQPPGKILYCCFGAPVLCTGALFCTLFLIRKKLRPYRCRGPPSDFDFLLSTQISKLEEIIMKKINLRDYYPYYTQDMIVEVPDEVADILREYKLAEAAYFLRTYRHKAYFSLDYDINVEHEAMVLVLTPADIFEQKEENARLYEALASLPEKQRNRITSHFLLGMSLSDIAKSEGTGVSSVHEGIQRGLRRLKKILEKMNTDPENYHQK